MGNDVMTIHQALDVYRKWLDTPQVSFLPETPGFDEALVRLTGVLLRPGPAVFGQTCVLPQQPKR
jgi:hypothetical protein